MPTPAAAEVCIDDQAPRASVADAAPSATVSDAAVAAVQLLDEGLEC